MNEWQSALLMCFGSLGAFVGLIVLARSVFGRGRRRRLEAAVPGLGLLYIGKQSAELDKLYSGLAHLGGGSFNNICRCTVGGAEVYLADWAFSTGRGEDAHSWEMTVCLVHRTGMRLPTMVIASADMSYTPYAPGGSCFAGDPPFEKAYNLQVDVIGDEAAAAREMFTDKVRRFFMERAGKRFEVSAEGDRLMLLADRYLKPAEAPELIADATTLAEMWAHTGFDPKKYNSPQS